MSSAKTASVRTSSFSYWVKMSVSSIFPSVRVPVLSVNMTVVLPKVSAAKSFRTTPLRFASRSTPTAKITVMATGRPSGTAETAIATAIRNISK